MLAPRWVESQWATPERIAILGELAKKPPWCVKGCKSCTTWAVFLAKARRLGVSLKHPHPDHTRARAIANAVEGFKAQDATLRGAYLADENRRLHHGAGPYRGYGRGFDVLAREVYRTQQPAFHPVGIGPDPLTGRVIAQVRVPSTDVVLFVDVSDAFKRQSKSARRKASRYGKGIPLESQALIDSRCQRAVESYWAK